MRTEMRVFGAVVALAAAALACDLTPPATVEPKSVEDAVAATLTAVAAGETAEATLPLAATISATPGEGGPPGVSVLRVVYTDGGNAWIINGANPPLQLTTSGLVENVRISDDGQKIAFTRRPAVDSPVELRAVNYDATGETTLLTPAQFDALYPLGTALHNDLSHFDFVPGTHDLLVNTRGIFEGPGLAKHDNVLVIDTDTGLLDELLAPGSGGDFTASPDGAQIAIVRPDSVDLINTDGSNHRVGLVTFASIITYSEYQFYPVPVWRQDSSSVGLVIPSPDPLNPPLSGTVWEIPATGGPATAHPAISGRFFLFGGHERLLAPDLAHVAFVRETATPNIEDLLVAAPDGTGETLVATGGIQWEGWAPDGVHYVYSIGGPMNLQLGTVGGAPAPFVVGTDVGWINATDYLYLTGSAGAWTLHKGTLGGVSVPLASPAGDFVQFDFDS
ncbi:MAG TPA: hypothetical protein VFI11_00810 [Anaerolineales bacterium]|nr:hypothetical protein [Anaerolineales bacterium]